MSFKFLFVGDLHSDLACAEQAAALAQELKCKEIVQVGDWGFCWTEWDTVEDLSEILSRYCVQMRFCDGNHEFHPKIRMAKRDADENIAPFITYQHRGTIKEHRDGTTMVFLGGAPSIDRNARIKNVDWWSEEYITDEDMQAALLHAGKKVHVLVTHDSPVHPPGFKETTDVGFNYRSAHSHACIQTVIGSLKPELNVHGHYHHRYDGWYEGTKVIGLGANIGKFKNLWYLYERSSE